MKIYQFIISLLLFSAANAFAYNTYTGKVVGIMPCNNATPSTVWAINVIRIEKTNANGTKEYRNFRSDLMSPHNSELDILFKNMYSAALLAYSRGDTVTAYYFDENNTNCGGYNGALRRLQIGEWNQ